MFCKLWFPSAMFVLFCVQVVQIYNNESSWREKKKHLSSANKQNICKLAKKAKKIKKKKSNWQDTQANS